MSELTDDLETRVQKFQHLELPGQPMAMHMGTSYLVSDLWRELATLRAERAKLEAALRDARPYVQGIFDQLAFTNHQHVPAGVLSRIDALLAQPVESAAREKTSA